MRCSITAAREGHARCIWLLALISSRVVGLIFSSLHGLLAAIELRVSAQLTFYAVYLSPSLRFIFILFRRLPFSEQRCSNCMLVLIETLVKIGAPQQLPNTQWRQDLSYKPLQILI